MKSKIDKIFTIMLYLNVVLLNIFIGATHTEPRIFLETFIILEAYIYMFISKLKKKEKIIIKGKIDIAVLIITLVTALPLAIGNYSSLSDTINIFILYLTMYSMFIMARNLIITPKEEGRFINVTLISSIPIIVFGIDRMNFNLLDDFYRYIGSYLVEDARMTSIFGYSNAIFAYIGTLIFIALGNYLNDENEKKASLYAI